MDTVGRTPLHEVITRIIELVKVLITDRAEKELVDSNGHPTRNYALRLPDVKIGRELLQ